MEHGYETCVVLHQDMPNIHAVQKAYGALAPLCQGKSGAGDRWLNKLDQTGWLDQLRCRPGAPV